MYAVVDCNNFYCSCERVFRPALHHRPVIVLSNNDGCAIARSEEAKVLGIDMAQPVFMIENKLKAEGVAVFSSNYTLYGDMSDRVMKTLAAFAPRMEIYSIDEAFLDLTGLLPEGLEGLAGRIRKRLFRDTGIPVTVGIAPTKTLAKMASRYAKKMQLATGRFLAIEGKRIQELLEATPVEGIWGIGRQHGFLLRNKGFQTAADLAAAPDNWVRRQMSVVGLRTLSELRGIPAIAWEEAPAAKKNIATSRSFGERLTQLADLEGAVANFAANCALKLRRQQSCAAELRVSLQTNPHKTGEPQYRRSIRIELSRPSSDSGLLIGQALKGLRVIYKEGYRYMKAGVVLGGIVSSDQVQGTLFEPEGSHQQSHRVMAVMDGINRRFGKQTMKMAVQGNDPRYQLRASHLSPRYTTDINQVLKVKI